jgi:hypothetical protein
VSGTVPPIGEMVPGAAWLIWSNSRAGWLNAAKNGATRIIERAARFTSDEAKTYCDSENAKAPAHGKFNALAVPDPSLSPLVRPWL